MSNFIYTHSLEAECAKKLRKRLIFCALNTVDTSHGCEKGWFFGRVYANFAPERYHATVPPKRTTKTRTQVCVGLRLLLLLFRHSARLLRPNW